MSVWQKPNTLPHPAKAGLLWGAIRVSTLGEPPKWQVHIICLDDETHDVHPNYYCGWRWADYELWMPCPVPAAPDQPQASARAWGWDYEICTGCSASLTAADTKAGGHVSCCPDRRMVTVRDLVAAYDAQRKPQAREDAQPVAWTGSGSIDALKAGAEGHMWPTKAAAHPVALYTHPAPDALRVAVEALEPFAAISGPVSGLSDGIEVRFDASFKLQNRDAMCVTRPMVVTVGDLRRAKNALAALQAEQKGGAA